MTLQLNNPNRVYSGVFDRFGRFLIDLKNELVATGLWVVTGSGDGDAAFQNQGQTAGPSFDVFTNATSPYFVGPNLDANYSAASNKNTISRPYAWVQLKEVGTTRTLQFRRAAGLYSDYSGQFMFRFIPGGVAASGASAMVAPAAVGSYFEMGGNPNQAGGGTSGVLVDYQSLLHTSNVDVVVNILTATTPRAKGVCPFVVMFAHTGQAKPAGGFFYESLVQADDADAHPYIFKLANSTPWDYAFGGKTQDYGPFYDPNYSAYGASCAKWCFDLYRNLAMSGGPSMPSSASPIAPAVGTTWKSNAPRVRLANGNSPGVSEHFLTNYLARNYPDTFNLASESPYVAAGMLLIPWKQNVAPMVGA